jgi:Rieske Fe-S protein
MSEHPPPTRRSFFEWTTYAVGAAAAAVTAIPVVGYFAGALRKKEPPWVNLGPASQFPVNETRLATFDNPIRQPWDGMVASTGVYVRNHGDNHFTVFAINCTHLGCPVTWFPQSGLFMCPCHGGVYYENGEHASGPPPRGLYHCVWRKNGDDLEIQAPHLPTLQDTLEPKKA